MTANGTAISGKGSNSVQMRHYNERVVLAAIRSLGEASKADIARYAHLTPPAISGIVDALVDAGYVIPRGKRFGGKGQPSLMFGLNPEGGFSIGLHLGRRTLDAVLLDFSGATVSFESHEYPFPEPLHIQKTGNEVIERFRVHLGPSSARIVGMGISAPYFLGGWERELNFPPEVSAHWREVDLTQMFTAARGLPLFIENDASAAAAAELVFGAGNRFRDFVHLSINTLIGGGLIFDGVLQTGPNGNAAAFGPMPVTQSCLSSIAAPPGPFEILLRRASVYGLINHLRHCGVTIDRVRELDPMPAAAAAPYLEWEKDCADGLAQAMIATLSVVDLEAIVIDGLLPQPLLQSTVARVRQRFAELLPMGIVVPEIIAGEIGFRASAMGAAILPIYQLFAPDSAILTKKAVEKKPLMIRSLG